MALRLYADECVDARVVAGLRRRGVDVVTAADEGLLGATDQVQLSHAIERGRVLLSRDQDFLRLAKERLGSDFPGLVFVLPAVGVGEVVRAVDFIAGTLDPADMVNRIEWVP
jgi:Domain of unknown function (DUF5615)